MGENLKPRRRKIGVMSLVMACAFMIGWVRSFVINDFVAADCTHATYRLGSFGGMLCFIRDTPATESGRFLRWDSFDEGEGNKYEVWDGWVSRYGDETEWQWDCGQFHFGSGKIFGTGKMKLSREVSFTFPYWFFVGPLAFLSANLLLSKPRKSTEKKTPQPTANEGT